MIRSSSRDAIRSETPCSGTVKSRKRSSLPMTTILTASDVLASRNRLYIYPIGEWRFKECPVDTQETTSLTIVREDSFLREIMYDQQLAFRFAIDDFELLPHILSLTKYPALLCLGWTYLDLSYVALRPYSLGCSAPTI